MKITIVVLIPRIAVRRTEDASQFEEELKEQAPARATNREAFDMRMII